MSKQIQLSMGKFAIVDDDDYEWLIQWKWSYDGRYAQRRVGIRMHRVIVQASDGIEVDHINGDPLDNRRCNLRAANSTQNKCNCGKRNMPTTSHYKGVSWHMQRKCWVAQIAIDRRHIYLGLFQSEIEAAKAYDDAARHYHGAFARTNFEEHQS
jgi:hypothetical protein